MHHAHRKGFWELAIEPRLELFAKLEMSEAAAQALSDSTERGVTALATYGLAEAWRSAMADWHRRTRFMATGSRCRLWECGQGILLRT